MKIFGLMDEDSSGEIDAFEAKDMLTMLNVPADTIKEGMISADINMDGKITSKEFVTFLQKANEIGMLPPLSAVIGQLKVRSNQRNCKATRIFKMIDSDGSGSIEAKEAQSVLGGMGLSADTIKEGMLGADLDMDGKVTLAEFKRLLVQAAALGELPPLDAVIAQLEVQQNKSHAEIQRLFRLVDRDHSGMIDSEEALSVLGAMGVSEAEIKEGMIGADMNMDGQISLKEFRRLMNMAAALGELPPLGAVIAQLETSLGRKRVAVLGGSFTPPTDRHLLMAANVIHLDLADEVWLVPCGPKKNDKLFGLELTSRDRLVMCHLAVDTSFTADFPVKVCDIETEEKTALDTPVLMARLKRNHPECTFSFVIGSNLLGKSGIPKWTCPPECKGWYKREKLLVFERAEHKISPDWLAQANVTICSPAATTRARRNTGQTALPPPPTLSHMTTKMMTTRFENNMTTGLIPAAVEGFLYRKKALAKCKKQFSLVPGGRKPRVAIFGGSFNPITDGHLKMACEVIHSKVVDQIWLVPCGKRPDKPSLKTPCFNRYVMVQLAVNSKLPTTNGTKDFAIHVNDFELDAPVAYITPVLLRELDKKYPQFEICFMGGADLLAGMHTWGGDDKSLDGWEKKRQMVVLQREGYEIPSEWKSRPNVHLVKNACTALVTSNHSSSNIRALIKASKVSNKRGFRGLQSIEGLTAIGVISHIGRNELFA